MIMARSYGGHRVGSKGVKERKNDFVTTTPREGGDQGELDVPFGGIYVVFCYRSIAAD